MFYHSPALSLRTIRKQLPTLCQKHSPTPRRPWKWGQRSFSRGGLFWSPFHGPGWAGAIDPQTSSSCTFLGPQMPPWTSRVGEEATQHEPCPAQALASSSHGSGASFLRWAETTPLKGFSPFQAPKNFLPLPITWHIITSSPCLLFHPWLKCIENTLICNPLWV